VGVRTFISFIHEDAGVARPLAAFLNHNGYKVFLTADEWMLYAGEIWLDRIRKELGEADIVLVLFSRRSATRPWIHFEAGAAWLSGKLMIPVCIGSLRVEDLPIPYNGIQALSLTDYDSAYYLLRSVHHYGHPDTTMVPPPNQETCNALLKAVGEYGE
jgi:hypothetical protein